MQNPFKLNIDYSKRTYGLDVLRAIAILEVVLVHGSVFLNKLDTNFPWIPLIDGVEIFFVLSGFLIGSIIIKTFEMKESAYQSSSTSLKDAGSEHYPITILF